MPERIRTFIAIDVPAKPYRDVLDELRQLGRPVRVAAEPLHLTVKFLGDTDAEAVDAISRVLRETAREHAAFNLDLQGLGAFPKPERPTVVWSGIGSPEPLAALAADLETRLEPLGFPRESRSFHPHVTLARIKARPPRELHELIGLFAETMFGTLRVSKLVFYRSQLTPVGPEYSVLSTAYLAHQP